MINVNNPIRVAIYSRVSTDEQASNGISLAQQPELVEQKLIALFGACGYEIVLKLEDPGMSGSFGPSVADFRKTTKSRKDRNGLRQVLQAIEDGEIDCVAAYDVSRLYRKADFALAFFAFVQTHKVRFVTVADNIDLSSASGELGANILAVIAQFQRKQANERIKANLDLRREKGLWQGTAPFGWRFTTEAERKAGQPRTLKPVAEQLAVVQRICDLYLKGTSEKKIADQLNAEGIRHRLKKKDPKTGVPLEVSWDWQSISNILKSCAHAGLVKQPDGSYKEGKHFEWRAYAPETFDQIIEAMKVKRKTLKSVPKERKDNLLSKIVKCAVCEQGLQFVKGQSEGADAYVCRGIRGRGGYHVYVPASLLLQAVLHEMNRFSNLPELMHEGEAHIKAMLASELQGVPDRIRELNQQRDKYRRQMDQALSDRREGLLDAAMFVLQRNAILTLQTPIDEQLQELYSNRDGARFYEARLQRSLSALADFHESWLGLKPEEQRELLRLAIEKAEVVDMESHNELRLKLGPFDEIVAAIPKLKATGGKSASGIKGLTVRELAALFYILERVRPVDAAARMGISAGTYSTLCKRAMKRVGAQSVGEAAKKAAPWIARVGHLLPTGPWRPRRRVSPAQLTITERIISELYRDGQSAEEIADEMGLPESDIKLMLESARSKEERRGA